VPLELPTCSATNVSVTVCASPPPSCSVDGLLNGGSTESVSATVFRPVFVSVTVAVEARPTAVSGNASVDGAALQLPVTSLIPPGRQANNNNRAPGQRTPSG
jgi:hypothetical protein